MLYQPKLSGRMLSVKHDWQVRSKKPTELGEVFLSL